MFTYNQNSFNDFPGDCTVTTLYQILYLTYGIKPPYTMLDSTVNLAVKVGLLFRWGASFDKMYEWFVNRIYTRTGIQMEVYKVMITNNDFENLLNEGYAFGLGLKNGNKNYLEFIKDKKLTKEEIDKIVEQGGGFGHNHAYYKRDGKYYISEVYTGYEIECDLSVLRHAVNKGLYYLPARTLKPLDTKYNRLLVKALQDYKNGVVVEMDNLPPDEFEAIRKASELRTFFR